MMIVHVHVRVKPEFVDNFIRASLENAQQSLKEPGVARFDVVQNRDAPEQFVLVEVYRTKEDPARHKATPHYQKWRDTVVDMMAEPRHGDWFVNLFPEDPGWG